MQTKFNISNLVRSQLPEFIQSGSGYEKFILFLEAYYEFLGQSEERGIEALRDIDQSLTDFADHFRYEFNNTQKYAGNEALFLRRVKQLYSAKGSEASFKLLFRLLFNKNVELIYPGDSVLIASDGKWIQDTAIFVNVTSGDAMLAVGKEVNLNTADKTIKLFVERVKFVEGTTYQFFINKNFFGTISTGDIIQSSFVTGIVLPTTSRITIEQAGTGFTAGQLFDITTGAGSGTRIKITSVSITGAVLSAQIIQFGLGYDTEFLFNLSSATALLNDTVTTTPTSITSQDFFPGFVDSGYFNTQDYWSSDYADGTYVGEIVATFFSDSTITGDVDACVLRIFIGATGRYPGYFANNDGFLSDAIFLQDSRFYQSYSYVIKIDEQLNTYKDAVKKYVHPAGFALFGEFSITNEFSLPISVTTEVI